MRMEKKNYPQRMQYKIKKIKMTKFINTELESESESESDSNSKLVSKLESELKCDTK